MTNIPANAALAFVLLCIMTPALADPSVLEMRSDIRDDASIAGQRIAGEMELIREPTDVRPAASYGVRSARV